MNRHAPNTNITSTPNSTAPSRFSNPCLGQPFGLDWYQSPFVCCAIAVTSCCGFFF